MKALWFSILATLVAGLAHAVELKPIEHKVIHDQRTFLRDATDRRLNVWTNDPAKAAPLLKEFEFAVPDPKLQKGQVLAIFFNDTITEDLTAITHNKTANHTFADYADSGIRFKLKAPPEGKKYSHATAVIFTPADALSNLGLRGMATGGLSEKR
ncbi:hypothetical protein [Luteolibacter soli]|uniref:Uncharacterized protein n=1 Tax=Luteolibacter soli TaxID=3135280 RepID=A0ABU9AUQ3_9BACT